MRRAPQDITKPRGPISATVDLSKALAAMRRADDAMRVLRSESDAATERELVLLRGLVHEIRNALLMAKLRRRNTASALRRIEQLVDVAQPRVGMPMSDSVGVGTIARRITHACLHAGLPRPTISGSVPKSFVCPMPSSELDVVVSTIISNAAAHAKTSDISVLFGIKNRMMRIEVRNATRSAGRRPLARGWGIGLWTAAAMVERAGGELLFERMDTAGAGGVVVTVVLPLVRAGVGHGGEGASGAAGSRRAA